MLYHSTNKQSSLVNFEIAVRQGLAGDNGLYFPETIPVLPISFFNNIEKLSDHEIAFQVAKNFIGDEIPTHQLMEIVSQTLSFPTPLVKVEKAISSLELFHGPTAAFKDVGARFMARTLQHFLANESQPATILVATSGDTGSAVASGFYGVDGINVVILYPSGKISPMQEKQLTTWGGNVHALEIHGTFDDCQRLAKAAFADAALKEKYGLTSANSINIARLIPQSFYYFLAYKQLKEKSKPIIISVPCGNLGNLTAGLMAWRMGLPIDRFVVASNLNDVVPKYLHDGIFEPVPSIQTVANAMDVGNPSNFARLMEIFSMGWVDAKKMLVGYSYDDFAIKKCIATVYSGQGYLLDPHGACAYMGLKEELKNNPNANGIFLETAHPAKFSEVVNESIGVSIEIPASLMEFMGRDKKATDCLPELASLKKKLSEIL